MVSRTRYAALMAAAVLWACGGGGEKTAEQPPARDLSLAPAESVARRNDRPMDQPAKQPSARPKQPSKQPAKQASPPEAQRPAQPKPAPTPMVGEGTKIDLSATDSINSRHSKKGDAVTATTPSPVNDASGRAVIPAGAVFSGTISDIAPAEHPGGQGRLVLTFSRVSFGGKSYAVQATVDTMATTYKGRGITGGEAVKVGAGTAIGALAGRLLGGNKKGTLIGAAAGAAAGVGVAAATRDVDIILPAGGLIRVTLTAPFEAKEITD